MKRRYKNKSEAHQRIATERIRTLFEQAGLMFREDATLANRYVALARAISMKYKVRIPSALKRRFCKHCHAYLVPGVNLRVRTREGRLTYYCLVCKRFWRMPYARKYQRNPAVT